MQLLRTWSVENAAIAIADQWRNDAETADALRTIMRFEADRGNLETEPTGRVTPAAVNAWLKKDRRWRGKQWDVPEAFKYRDTSEVSRYLQGGMSVEDIAKAVGWTVQEVQQVADAKG